MLLDMSLEGMLDRIENNDTIPMRTRVWACMQSEWKVIRARVMCRNADIYRLHGQSKLFSRKELYLTKDEALDEIIRRINTLKDNDAVIETAMPKRGRPRKTLSDYLVSDPVIESKLDEKYKINPSAIIDNAEYAFAQPFRQAEKLLNNINFGGPHASSKDIN